MEDNSFMVACNPPIIIPAPMFSQAGASELDEISDQRNVCFRSLYMMVLKYSLDNYNK